MLNDVVVVIDFETTGLSPEQGDRITEVAALRVSSNGIVDRYESLVDRRCQSVGSGGVVRQ